MTTIKTLDAFTHNDEATSIGELANGIINNVRDDMASAHRQYNSLDAVLKSAYEQAAFGKGKERHNGRDISFDRQPIMEISRMCGLGYPTGQAQKKTQEAVSMFNRGEKSTAKQELLGAINYLAAAILLIDEA